MHTTNGNSGLIRAVEMLTGCLAAVIEIRRGMRTEASGIKRTLRETKTKLQMILEEQLLQGVLGALPTCKLEVQRTIEHCCDVQDFAGDPARQSDISQRLGQAESLLAQLIEEITTGTQKVGHIEAKRLRKRQAKQRGHGGHAHNPLRRTERGMPNMPRTRRHTGFVPACGGW